MSSKKLNLITFLENIGSYSPMSFSASVQASVPNLKDKDHKDPFDNYDAFYGQNYQNEEQEEEDQEERVNSMLYSLIGDDELAAMGTEEDESRPADIIDRNNNNLAAVQTNNTWTHPPDELEQIKTHKELIAAIKDLKQELAARRTGEAQPQEEEEFTCTTCEGTGYDESGHVCPRCKGTGVLDTSTPFDNNKRTSKYGPIGSHEPIGSDLNGNEEEEHWLYGKAPRKGTAKYKMWKSKVDAFKKAKEPKIRDERVAGPHGTYKIIRMDKEEEEQWEEDESDLTKQDKARQLFAPLVNQGKSRQEIINQFMKMLGVTNTTAVSYYQRLAKEAGLTTSGDRDLAGEPPGLGVVSGVDASTLHAPQGNVQTRSFKDTKSNVDGYEVEDNPDRQGLIRTVKGAHLVYKRKSDDGTFDELWVFKSENDMKDALKVRRAILAGTDIPPKSTKSQDGSQSYTLTSLGNGQIMHIKGLPN